MDAHLQHHLLERLGESDLADSTADLVLAAIEGKAELDAALGGGAPARDVETVQPELEASPPGAFLASVKVQGFRGVGPAATLALTPGPGLTLVVGRNGSGKSSFAEGLELLMTGANYRWEKRTQVWKQGWQNLHFSGGTEITGDFQVDGRKGTLTLRRSWPHGARLDPGECKGLDGTGWPEALARYRPFLSYNELGAMFDEPKTMYEALAAILGLEDIEGLQAMIRDARLARERGAKAVRAEIKAMTDRFAAIDDERAREIVAALGDKPVDFDAIEAGLEGHAEEGDPSADLRALSALRVPEPVTVDAAFDALTVAREQRDALEGTDAARAASLVGLLETALRHDEAHQDPDCPVCGTAGVIDERWRAGAAQAVGRLAAEAKAVEDAQRAIRDASRRVADLLPPSPPPVLARARELELDPGPLEVAWERWAQARRSAGEAEAETALRSAIETVADAAQALAAVAAAELERREDAWRPVAKLLAGWLPGAREAAAAAARLDDLKGAEAWVRETAVAMQAERLAPIEGKAKKNWEALRQESNVSLGGFQLKRSGASKSAEIDVTVDGSDASAFGVMSQGELHALAVSVFLPRAALPESPFRFMVIDDPVQSMDPAKVDGLARVLDMAAKDRQVVVFTHDERLAEAVRRLNIAATVLGVTRRPQSVVEVREIDDPVNRYLDDARALLREPSLPDQVARRVVPGFCRHAIEAGCATAVRRRRLERGERHVDVESELEKATTLYTQLSLALYDEPGRTNDVLKKINAKWGAARGDAVKVVNKGAHEAVSVDLHDLVRDSALLARGLAELA